jgi:hypothetical protein
MFLTLGTLFAFAADKTQPAAKLTAAEIVDKNVAARGGLKAWRAVQTISMKGKIDAGPSTRPKLSPQIRKSSRQVSPKIAPAPPVEQVQLPVLIEMKRSHKSRMEIQFKGQTAIQAFDGTNGWKFRPYLNRKDIEPFTPDELKSASKQAELDGSLIDYKAKGSKVELVGTEKVGERDTYKLALTTSDGQVQHIWIDAVNFLEVKAEGVPRKLDGKMHAVDIYYDEFRPSPGGLVLPYVLETRVEGLKTTEKIEIESVLVNPKLEDSLFVQPK